MDVIAVYGFMLAGAVICLVVPIPFLIAGVMLLTETEYEIPGPWKTVAVVTTIAAPVLGFVGAAALVGPSSDAANFFRAVGGVLAGLATYFVISWVGLPRAPQQFRDGPATDADAAARYNAQPGEEIHEFGWFSVPGWQPSATFVARYVLFACIVPPVAGVVVAVLIAG